MITTKFDCSIELCFKLKRCGKIGAPFNKICSEIWEVDKFRYLTCFCETANWHINRYLLIKSFSRCFWKQTLLTEFKTNDKSVYTANFVFKARAYSTKRSKKLMSYFNSSQYEMILIYGKRCFTSTIFFLYFMCTLYRKR